MRESGLARLLSPLAASPWRAFSDIERDRLQPVVLCWKRDLGPARGPAKSSACTSWSVRLVPQSTRG